ncbi:hypothetical protein BC830DRAFT_1116828 [Chytriomyces sp. MP71]|nr:hypothetical protein BC830DRAFT_1116828 [Chytriomyces sp. MP71]
MSLMQPGGAVASSHQTRGATLARIVRHFAATSPALFALFSLGFARIVVNWIVAFARMQRRSRCRMLASTGKRQFDYIIVGGGSSGCALAARLCQDPTASVLLVEAGMPAWRDPRINIPALFGALQRTDLDWQYETTTAKETRERVHFWPRGKVLGGCSSTNAMLYVRGNKEDYNEWESKHGCKGWNFKNILPYFLKSEGCLVDAANVDAGFHSTAGPLKVTRAWNPRKISKLFVKACERVGLGQGPLGSISKANALANDAVPEMGVDYNGKDQYGAGLFYATIVGGERCSAAKAFIAPLVDPASPTYRPNLTVLTGHRAIRLEQSGRKDGKGQLLVDGVVLMKESDVKAGNLTPAHRVVFKANKEVILSCGAVGTPVLLQHSGIGRKADLEKIGIPVVADIPAVGYHMQDHIFVGFMFEDLAKEGYRLNMSGALKALAMYAFNKTGLLQASPCEATAFFNAASEEVLAKGKGRAGPPNTQIHFISGMVPKDVSVKLLRNTMKYSPLDPTKPSALREVECLQFEKEFTDPPSTLRTMTVLPTLLHPLSKGSVSLRSADPLDKPIISPNYLAHQQDMDVLVAGATAMRVVMDEARALAPDAFGREVPDTSIVNEIKRLRGVPEGMQDPALEEAIVRSREYLEEHVRRDAYTVYHPVGTCRMGPKGPETVVGHEDLKVHGFGNLRVADASIMPEITSGNTNAPCIMIGEVCADMISGLF